VRQATLEEATGFMSRDGARLEWFPDGPGGVIWFPSQTISRWHMQDCALVSHEVAEALIRDMGLVDREAGFFVRAQKEAGSERCAPWD
jgi:hypothetical protein